MQNWKAIRPRKEADWELYDLAKDIGETTNVAAEHPDILKRMRQFAEQSHEPVRPGSYSDRTRHERDRWAKWGTTRPAQLPKRGKMNRIKAKNLVPPDQLKLVRSSSENRSNDRLAAYAIDGNPRTLWHSQFSKQLTRHPHELVIDLGAEYEVRGFWYLARQDASWNGAFANTEFAISNSPDEFGEPAVRATFKKVKTAQAVDCKTPQRGRYVRVRVLSEVNGGPWASAADIAVVGTR